MPEAEDLEPVYLTLEDALELYAAIIDGSPTQARSQLRSRAGLEGALERPALHAHYESADLALQAAVLAHGIAEGQSFVDGNKRLALVAMLTFLEVNGKCGSSRSSRCGRRRPRVPSACRARSSSPRSSPSCGSSDAVDSASYLSGPSRNGSNTMPPGRWSSLR